MALVSNKTAQIIERGKKAAVNFEEFLRFVMGIKPGPHQKQLISELQRIGDNPTSGIRLLVVMPPGGGKSTILAAFLAWMIGRYPEEHYGLFSYADAVGWERSRAVRDVIEHSKPYHITFPTVLAGKSNWGVSSFTVARDKVGDIHPTLRAGGTTSAVVAYRLNGLVIDDPHDPKNVNTPTQRQKVIKNYDDAIKTRLTTGSWQVVISTRWADEDFVGVLLKRKGWKLIHIRALVKRSGQVESYWPEKYPIEHLEAIRYETPVLFAIQYMGDTTGGDTGIIRRLHTYEEDPHLLADRLELMCCAGWDTAMKDKEQNDFFVCYIAGLDKHGRIYVLDRFKARIGVPEMMDVVNDQWAEWKLAWVWVEDTASGTPAIQMITSQMPHIRALPVKATSGGKAPRVHFMAPLLHGGHVLFPRNAGWFQDCEYQLTHFPYTDHDDDPDALYVLLSNLTQVRHPASTWERPNVHITMS